MTLYGAPVSPWDNDEILRAELFGSERLEQHAASLATAQRITPRRSARRSLAARLKNNETVLLAAYQAIGAAVGEGRAITPAAEWLLDNYHLVEEQIREIRADLPPGFYRQLPRLAEGPFAGYPRVFGLAWASVAHSDSRFDPDTLRLFVSAYQRVQPLTIGELWAVAITLRIVLVENLRRAAVRIVNSRAARQEADGVADRLLGLNGHDAEPGALVRRDSRGGSFPPAFVVQLVLRLRDQDPRTTPARQWLDERLSAQGTTADEIVHEEHQRQGTSNVTVRNIITSMRLLSDVDWPEFFESVSLVDELLRSKSDFAAMDFASRDLYRRAIEQLSRGSRHTELAIARAALAAGASAADRRREPGYHLIGAGRRAFEKSLGYRASGWKRLARLGTRGPGEYIGSIFLLAAIVLVLPLIELRAAGAGAVYLALFMLLGLVPALDAAVALVNRTVTRGLAATIIPGLALREGIPPPLRTLVVVPALLTTQATIDEQIERLEIHHLASPDGEVHFALLSDWTDAPAEHAAGDAELLDIAAAGIARLNLRYPPGPSGNRFVLLHRRRVWSAGQKRWMGWERKRGKLHELNRLLRGAADTTFIAAEGRPPLVPADVRYVITLDADTRLPRDTVRRLVGKMAHALNRPRFDASTGLVLEGYGVLQPRVAPSLPMGCEGSVFQRVFSSASGIDPYAGAVSDVYQDLFGLGSYAGKGIYDVDAFEAALADRVPEGTLLSHDLFEGTFARAGLVSDVEVVEEFPSRYDVAAARQHRWARGDWQLLPWILGRGDSARESRGGRTLPLIGLWKMSDNLRRTLSAPAGVAALFCGWALLPAGAAIAWTAFITATIVLPALLPVFGAIIPGRSGVTWRSHLRALRQDDRLAATLALFLLTFLADQATLMLDAIVRTLFRVYASHRNLLQWMTAAQAKLNLRLTFPSAYRRMAGAVAIATAGAVLVAYFRAENGWLAAPFLLLWAASPALAVWISRSPRVAGRVAASAADTQALRLIARRTWRYFDTFVTADDQMLPPDNFQEDPRPVLAHRTSPTNIGLYLLSAVSARDFGWLGTLDFLARVEATFATLDRLERFRGHLFNWYDTRDLRPLDPRYVSTVDSGNLAGHLIALANACRGWRAAPAAANGDCFAGVRDALILAREAWRELPEDRRMHATSRDQIDAAIGALETALAAAPGTARDAALEAEPGAALETAPGAARDARPKASPGAAVDAAVDAVRTGALDAAAAAQASGAPRVASLMPLAATLADIVRTLAREWGDGAGDELLYWSEATLRSMRGRQHELVRTAAESLGVSRRLAAIETTARAMAQGMQFDFLFDRDRRLFSIGCSADGTLDSSCYDLLASEARLASFVAIAKNDAPARHWFRLGRSVTPVGRGAALISWSGSMFEYLMPSLVMRAPAGSLLEHTSRLIVQRQIRYAHDLGVPWGISESAYNARDIELTYQYSNFGVPGLGLKRGLRENIVIAPYATALAAMVDPESAVRNFERLAGLGARGRFGFRESLDYTRSRVPEGSEFAIVRAYMAHHQGMTIVAIANVLLDGRMRARFHAEPGIQATELLLQERAPRDVSAVRPRAEEMAAAAPLADTRLPEVRRLHGAHDPTPQTHLLSNGRYSVMLTSAGSGYSRWRDLAVTRWREDTTRDDAGSYVFLRDVASGAVWSAGYQPSGVEPESYEVTFTEDRAEFIRKDATLTVVLEIVVSTEDDAEVRRLSITNTGHRDREIEVTSYAELALAPPAADASHQAFSKLFVQTEYVAQRRTLLATRRKRTPDEPDIWAGHHAVVEGAEAGEPEIETDRARFLGRGREVRSPLAVMDGRRLSNTVGTVLDPVFALRYRIEVPAGATARIAFWTGVAASREALLDMLDRQHAANSFARASTLAWTQAQVELRHFGIDSAAAGLYQRLAGHLLYADRSMRPPSNTITAGSGPPAGLWAQGISGDLPILLLRIDAVEDIAIAHELLQAHGYWQLKGLAADFVILNERAASYVQDLQTALEAQVRMSQSRPQPGSHRVRGSVYVLRADLIAEQTRTLLSAVARVVLVAQRGVLADQLDRLRGQAVPAAPAPAPLKHAAKAESPPGPAAPALDFFNGLGGFDAEGREYVTVLGPEQSTPAPWINVVANPHFGFQVAADGSGFTWSLNSREHQLTPWSNDPVADRPGEALYLRDEESGETWGPTAAPLREPGATYTARHGQGYSRFELCCRDIESNLLMFVPMHDAIKISRLALRNTSSRTRRLSVTAYAEWVLGTARGASAPFIVTELDPDTRALFARNPWDAVFGSRVAFADLAGRPSQWTADRCEFLGRHGTLQAPAALAARLPLGGRGGAGLDPCCALQTSLALEPGESAEVVFFLGEAADAPAARVLLTRYRTADLDAVFQEVIAHWEEVLGAVQVKTPDRSLDIMLNRWLLYQTLSCRLWARTAFYQASGAYGFRDQLQDGMALAVSRPDLTREHLLRAGGRQFVEGDVQHWWLPAVVAGSAGQGVRTRISDDVVWLAFCVSQYIDTTGDGAVLDAQIPFLDGRALQPEEHDAFYMPGISDETATLFEHCARALDHALPVGAHGLPLFGTGDWNDGMNRVGEKGKGESVWLGWFLQATLVAFAPLATARGEHARASRWLTHAATLQRSLEQAWDGDWYRRGYFDDGTPLGSAASAECRIDSIAQSWSVMSAAAAPGRAAHAMAQVQSELVRREAGLVLLFAPPFDRTPHDPGYIKGYPPGIRENGGQYTHAATWTVIAAAMLGDGNEAAALFSLLNPISHSSTRADVQRYKVEPYVVAADVYSVAPHVGRGGWTWYTGSAGWMYRAGLEWILGFRVRAGQLDLSPCIPANWPGFEISFRYASSRYEIRVENPHGVCRGAARIEVDGAALAAGATRVALADDGRAHRIVLVLGEPVLPEHVPGEPMRPEPVPLEPMRPEPVPLEPVPGEPMAPRS
jgi:cyclic beta-1,2-glucan synthetase